MPEPVKWILLIGVSFYLEEKQRLAGAVNDVEDFEELLEQYPGPKFITKLVARLNDDPKQESPPGSKEEWPTFDNITRKLVEIRNRAAPGDLVHIHFSGHGAWQRRNDKEYTDRYPRDAALVLFEPSSPLKQRYLRGVDLAHYIDKLVARGLMPTVVLDCCYSGSVSRGENARIREIPWNDSVSAEFPAQWNVSPGSSPRLGSALRDGISKDLFLPNSDGCILYAACGPDQTAIEAEDLNGRRVGAFSHYIRHTLNHFKETEIEPTYGAIHRHVCAQLHVPLGRVNPVLIGNPSTLFMGTGTSTGHTRSGCEVVSMSENGEITLNVGRVHGVCAGDEYAVVSDAKESITPAIVIVTKVFGVYSIATGNSLMSSKADKRPIALGFKATLCKMSSHKAHVTLFDGADSSWTACVGQSLWLKVVNTDAPVTLEIPNFFVTIVDGNEYAIFDNADDRIANMPSVPATNPNALGEIVSLLEHLAKFSFTETLQNNTGNCIPETDFRIEARVERDTNALVSSSSVDISEGGIVSITCRNDADVDLHLTVMNLRPLRQIKQLYPPDRDNKVVLKKKTVTFRMSMTIPKDIKLAGLRQAEDVCKFIVATRSMSLQGLELGPPLGKTNSSRGDASNPLLSLRLGVLAQQKPPITHEVRGEGNTAKDRWTCRTLRIYTHASQ